MIHEKLAYTKETSTLYCLKKQQKKIFDEKKLSLFYSLVKTTINQLGQVNQSEPKWSQVHPSKPKQTCVNPSESKWTQVRLSEPKWIKVNQREFNWTKVNPSEPRWTKLNPSKSMVTQINLSEPEFWHEKKLFKKKKGSA